MTRNILITGGNSGIGKEMARALAANGDRVVIASSNLANSERAADEIRRADSAAQVEAMALDLSNFEAIDRFADDLLQRMPVIDVLILNAGLYTHGARRLDNGLEAMIGVMHFGHFRLTQRLLDAVCAADAGRIVVTSSYAHRIGRIRQASFEDPSLRHISLEGYAQAKLANLLFTRELARRLADTSVTVNAFHPGSVATGIWQELPGPLQRLFGLFLVDSEQGADTGVWLANADEAREHSGEYFYKRRITKTSSASRDRQLAAWLWKDSEARM
ncbi:SDR family NAD(P)-dependent oxidoreductase [Salinisphaera aquimarina]|uniref:SDR family NAD(P)-dependent oxidoreductase n=1 Tax=Salinisphaera aquimarina TaxID=2094031 RepID=A0ABV7ESP8_9GAMM